MWQELVQVYNGFLLFLGEKSFMGFRNAAFVMVVGVFLLAVATGLFDKIIGRKINKGW